MNNALGALQIQGSNLAVEGTPNKQPFSVSCRLARAPLFYVERQLCEFSHCP